MSANPASAKYCLRQRRDGDWAAPFRKKAARNLDRFGGLHVRPKADSELAEMATQPSDVPVDFGYIEDECGCLDCVERGDLILG
jgi:hypothetical protein